MEVQRNEKKSKVSKKRYIDIENVIDRLSIDNASPVIMYLASPFLLSARKSP